jgi:hypothetical protein
MTEEELKKTPIWELYEQGRNYCRLINMYTDTDKNYEFYNGNQWKGLKVSGIEPVQLNFIKPVIKYKVSNIMANLYGINYSSENYENKEFRSTAEETCKLLNKRASKIYEKDYMDYKLMKFCKDAAINDEGIMYVTYDTESGTPSNEVLTKNDVYYGNENDSDIQRQPYILIKQRRSVMEVRELAESEGVSEEKLSYIIGDNDNFEEAGDQAKLEKDAMCTMVTKLWKENGTVWYSKAVKYQEIVKPTDSGLKYYPLVHMLWEEKEGSARGEGEVRHLIPNQIEVNKTIMRRLITVKNTAYPQKVVDITKVANPNSVNEIGGVIKAKGNVDDVNKIFANVHPAQMSTDVEKVQNELIQITRDLAGAGDNATGDINPESASGRAILAVQQAHKQPLVEQTSYLKRSIEDLARIWLDMITTYADNKITLEEEEVDPNTNETFIVLKDVPVTVLEQLKASVKVDITPKGAFDKYAQELSLENLLNNGFFNIQRLPELEIYNNLLDDDSVMPKQKITKAIEKMREEQQKIAMINAEAQLMQERASQFLNSEPEAQASTIQEAQMGIEQGGNEPQEVEAPM